MKTPRDLTLADVQTWFQSVLINGDGADSSFAQEVNLLIQESSRQSSLERVDVYRNAYLARLLDVMREEFPTLNKFLGEETFNGISMEYLIRYPSDSYTLGQLGRRFPMFLNESKELFESSSDLETNTMEPGWSQFLVDVATLERHYSDVFDGPGTEGQSLLTADDVSAISEQDIDRVIFNFAPCVRLVELEFPVHEFITACRLEDNPVIPSRCRTWLAVTRCDFVVRRFALTHMQFQLLTFLRSQRPLGESLAMIIQGVTEEANINGLHSVLESQLLNWFRDWTKVGLFQSLCVD